MSAVSLTLNKFCYPETSLDEFDYWHVLIRNPSVTEGSLVIVSKSEATAWPDTPHEAFVELACVTTKIEKFLRTKLGCLKVNYLMLMMVDPAVHFHVIPRYDNKHKDSLWPAPPDLRASKPLNTSDIQFIKTQYHTFFSERMG